MAGGSSNRKEGGSLDNSRLRQCHHHHHHQQLYRHPRHSSNVTDEPPPPLSECFKKRQKIECERTYSQCVKTLQRDILRIFTECRHSDFYIIHGCSVVKTNNCIVRTRSPQLYKILEALFVHSNNIIKCYIETPEIFQRIKDFSRLLYSNLDVEQEEEILVEFILTAKRNFVLEENSCTDYTFFPKERTCEDILYSNVDLVDATIVKKENGANDLSPSTSDMADSGLETGSLSPLENTESENSVTDLEDSHATDYVSMDDDFIKISLNGEIEKSCDKKYITVSSSRPSTSNECHNGQGEYETLIKSGSKQIPHESRITDEAAAGCSSRKLEEPDFNAHYGTPRMAKASKGGHETETTTTTTTTTTINDDNIDEISRYEAEVLSEPFYESDCGSNENEPTNSFVPTGSFEFVDPTIMSPTTSDPRRGPANHYESFSKIADEKLCPNHEARSMTVEELRHELSHSNDQALKKSSSSINSYYFIDASSLNDEDEIASLTHVQVDLTSKENGDSHGNIKIHTSTTGNYVPTKTASNFMHDDQNYKPKTRKLSTRQDGHERVAEFERELKMTEYLKPLIEQRKVKRVDSITDDKLDGGTEKGIEKETLVVEIKEADSGESTHPSPCSDNNANSKESNVSSKDDKIRDKTVNREIEAIDDRPSSLIRRNTFELDPNDEKLSVLRQEYERRQGHLIFQSSIPQYSGHRVDGDSCFEPSNKENPVVAEVIAKFSVDLPHTGVKYSTITYMTTSDHQDGTKSLITTDQEVSVKNDVAARKYSTSSLLLLDSKETLRRGKEISSSGATLNETKLSGGQFLSSQDSPEEMTSWASDRDSSARSLVVNDHETNYPMSKSPSEKLLIDSCSESDDGSRNCCNSLPVTLNCQLPRERRLSMNSTMKRPKRDETTPIISGGVSTVDFSKPTDSPIVHRKTESTPIVSGGSVMMNEPRERAKTTRMASSMSAWVVDMSDCGKNNSNNNISHDNCQTAMSQSFSSSDCVNGKNRKKIKSNETKHSSLGFFVNLKDMDGPKEKRENCSQEIRKITTSETAKQSCEFFIDISEENKAEKNCHEEVEASNGKMRNLGESSDKKNMFSMFIDMKKPSEKLFEETHRVGGSRLFDKRGDARHSRLQGGDSGESSSSSQIDQSGNEQNSNGSEKGKSGVFMFIESDSPVVRRRALSSSRPAFQRHSWNVDKTQLQGTGNGQLSKDCVVRREHKRAHSVSVDRADLRKLQTKSSNSSHSLSEVARADTLNGTTPRRFNEQESSRNTDTSTEEVFEYDIRDTPPNSHIETGENEDLRGCVKQRDYKELLVADIPESTEIADTRIYEDECSEVSGWEKTGTESTEGHTRKSETFDISTGGSGPSPESDNHDFDIDDLRTGEMANYNEILQVEHPAVVSKVFETHKSLTETIKKIECELKKPEYGEYERTSSDSLTPVSRKDTKSSSRGSKDGQTKAACSSFVRLSDLDKTPARSRTSDVTSREDKMIYRMSNSIPETSWVESKLAMNRSNGPVRALPRKFTSIMSTSLPAKHKSPIEDADCEAEGLVSESDLSSMQSSMGRSGADVSTEETETSSMGVTKPYNRLGEDLLRMFLEEINPDVTIDVAGRRIRAHKCILSSRCQYFAAILSGGWIESAGNVISLQGYSYNAVHFALCHIYSGESNIPETLSIVELATLADMLCLEGLKEVIGYTLKVKYCHLFHKPCQVCAVGVLECMPLAAAYGLDEVYRKSLRWITKYFVRIWPCKAFATLPRELMDKCYHQHIVHMSTDNVLQTMMDCDKLLATLRNVRWAEPVFRMVSNLLETAVKFISENLSGVLGNENFQALGRDLTWNISRIEDNFLAAADRLPPDQACKSYSKLNKMLAATQVEEPLAKPPWSPLFIDFLRKIQSRVEKCLVKEASRAARTTTWLKMDLELRRRIQELACLVILPHETIKRPSRHSNFLKEPRIPSARTPASRSLDLRRVKMAISEHSDRTTKQAATTVTTTTSAPNTTQQVKKPLLVKPKSDPLERKNPQEEKQVVSDSVALRPKSWPNKLEVKSRYLEPRNKSVTKETAQQAQHERVIVQQRRKIMISSSDSSRTSSPAMKRAIDKKPLVKMKLTIKKDVKALSSDSLAEATSSRASAKKEPISKSCGITRPESPSFKQKDTDIGISADSLAEPKKKQQQQQQSITKKKQTGKMDTSMSTDSLMGEIGTTPKSTNVSNKVSPTMGRVGTANKTQAYDRVKKSSPPMQQKSPLTTGRRLPTSLECSTAASRNRAAAISAYHGSPNLRRNLLDAAKTPDVPAKTLNGGVTSKLSPRQQNQTATVTSTTSSLAKKDKRETLSNQTSTESPSKRSSPKSNGTHRTNRATSVAAKRPVKAVEERAKTKCHNGDAPKQPTVGSRSGTFLKDEPTVLKKTDIKTAQISGS